MVVLVGAIVSVIELVAVEGVVTVQIYEVSIISPFLKTGKSSLGSVVELAQC